MKFGVLLDHQYPKSDDLGQRLDELVEITETARDLGFDSLFGIHHYLASLQSPQPLLVLSRLISSSGSMQLGTGVYLATLPHPVETAEATATLDQLSGGRLVLGVGAGYRDDEFDSFGIDRRTRGSRLVETLDLLRQLWSGAVVDHEGEHFRIRGQQLSVLPAQQPRPPIWVGANNPKTIRRAARIGDAWIASPNVKRRWAKGNLEEFKDELAAHGGTVDGRDLPILRELHLAEDDATAHRRADPYLREEYLSYSAYDLEHFRDMYEDLRAKSFLVGSADTVAAGIADLAEAGFNHFIFRVFWSGMPLEMTKETLERFARDVMPRFRSDA
jgi:alkanesulfonate monooxygenase SsuD/methylene tetrahydromethanopterin reductase-like flavin-dependent oxidoreductase (luciferase family)